MADLQQIGVILISTALITIQKAEVPVHNPFINICNEIYICLPLSPLLPVGHSITNVTCSRMYADP